PPPAPPPPTLPLPPTLLPPVDRGWTSKSVTSRQPPLGIASDTATRKAARARRTIPEPTRAASPMRSGPSTPGVALLPLTSSPAGHRGREPARSGRLLGDRQPAVEIVAGLGAELEEVQMPVVAHGAVARQSSLTLRRSDRIPGAARRESEPRA